MGTDLAIIAGLKHPGPLLNWRGSEGLSHSIWGLSTGGVSCGMCGSLIFSGSRETLLRTRRFASCIEE